MQELTAGVLLTRQEGTTAVLTLNRPEARNALSEELFRALEAAFASAAEDDAVRAIVITGSGDRAFCAGADIRQMRTMNTAAARHWSRRGHEAFQMVEDFSKPIIAALNGAAAGGGCELALACDFRLMSEAAVIGQPEIKLGLIPGWGGTQRLPRLVGPSIAKDLLFTGRMMPAVEALQAKLVNEVVSPEQVLPRALEFASRFASLPPLAIAYAKRAMALGRDLEQREGIAAEGELFAQCFETEDHAEGLAAFLEKRPAQFRGR